MNTKNRTCATCTAFNPSRSADQPVCWNLISFIAHLDSLPELARDSEPDDFCDEHCTAEDEGCKSAATARYVADSTPEFLTAMQLCLHLHETLGLDHPDTARALQLAIALSPNSLKEGMAAIAREMDLIPEANGYTEDGDSVFSLEAVAEKHGLSMEVAQTAIEEMLEFHADHGIPFVPVDETTVHSKQEVSARTTKFSRIAVVTQPWSCARDRRIRHPFERHTSATHPSGPPPLRNLFPSVKVRNVKHHPFQF